MFDKGEMMNYTVIGFIVVCVLMYVIAFFFNPSYVKGGLQLSLKTFLDPKIGLIPLIVSATLIAGLVQTLIPRASITSLLGREAGFKGIAIGALIGALLPGGPYVVLPLLGGLYKAGAGVGTIISFVTSWALISLTRVPIEISFLGVKVTAIKIGLSMLLPLVMGTIGQRIFDML